MRSPRYLSLIFVIMISFFSEPLLATTWGPKEKVDPISGDKTTVAVILTYGNYIYDWPSKYDMVFWPLTDENWIWFNPKSGYAAFGDDFEKLSDEEKKTLTDWLAKNYNSAQLPKSHEEKLAWLEKVYSLRQMNDDFWCLFYRLMAYVHGKDEEKSTAYVKKALPLLLKKLEKNPEGTERIECLYLLGEYHRRIGENEKAKGYFQQAKTAKYKDENGKEQVGHPYILELIQDREKLINK